MTPPKLSNWGLVTLVLADVIVLALNTAYLDNLVIGTLGTALYASILAGLLGNRWFAGEPQFLRWWLGLLSLLTLIALSCAILTQIHVVDPRIVYGVLGLLAFIVFVPVPKIEEQELRRDDSLLPSGFSRANLVGYSMLASILLATLLAARTGEYIYAYWDLLPAYFWYVFGLAAAGLVLVLIGHLPVQTKLLAIAVLALIIHGSLLILGVTEYDGDGYRHLSSERYLLLEKPIYTLETADVSRFLYVGAWGLHAILAQMTGLSLDLIHNVVPYLAAAIFPIILLFGLGRLLFRGSTLASLILATTPLFFYELNVHGMISNPKTFGYVLLLFSMFLATRSLVSGRRPGVLDAGVALTSLFVYPLSGAFSVFFWALSIIFGWSHRFLKASATLVVFLVLAGLFPWLDLVLGARLPTEEITALLLKIMTKWLPSILAVNWQLAFPLLLYFLVFIGWKYLKHRLPSKDRSLIWLFLLPVLASQLAFAWRLILPEQPAFTARIGIPLYVTLLPFLAAGIGSFLESGRVVFRQAGVFVIGLIIFVPFLVASYLQGPFTWSISTHELDAIRTIDALHPDRNYVALTEEITAAAANGILGYTTAPYYRYPSGPLHAASMQMAANPSREYFEAVRQQFGVDHVYYFVNPLPPFSETSVEQAKAVLPVYQQFGERLYVFKYPPEE